MKTQSFKYQIVLLILAFLFMAVGVEAKTIRILAIGNSFSEDALETYLHGLAKANGDTVIIGNLFIGGCSLEKHWSNANNRAVYSYRKIGVSGAKATSTRSMQYAIQNEKWDYITLQQVSHWAGMYETYFPYITNLINYIKSKATNPNVEIGLHQTWAYAKTSTHSGFSNYSKNQMQMYEAIVNAVQRVAEDTGISLIIPSGTAIQNGRTSFVGDVFCRDGYHLDYYIGRYTAACVWYEMLLGKSALGNSRVPAGLSPLRVEIAQMAAHYAVQNPFSITDMDYEYGLRPETFKYDNAVNIDFGTTKSAAPWNNLTSFAKGAYVNQLTDVAGGETPIKIEVAEAFAGVNTNGPASILMLNDWLLPKNANSDSFFGNAVKYNNKTVEKGAFLISNLNPALQYDFKMFSSRTATDNRETCFLVEGANSVTVYLNSSGNTSASVQAKQITPKADGTVKITVGPGQSNNSPNKFFYINALQIAKYVAPEPEEMPAFYVDFGPAAGATISPSLGNYWNNVTAPEVSANSVKLKSAKNNESDYGIQIIRKFVSNVNTGLLEPNAELLGDMAVSSATSDYFYVDGSANISGAIKIKNLKPDKAYRFSIFASRLGVTETRITRFNFYGLNMHSGVLQASGSGMGGAGVNQNTKDRLVSDYIFPDSNGEIIIEAAKQTGVYAYINALKMEEFDDIPAPEYMFEQEFFVDFGYNNYPTQYAAGNYWNNMTSVAAGAVINLTNAKNMAVPYNLEVTKKFAVTSASDGGLTAPNAGLLGELAVATATRDYFYVDGVASNKGILKISNLDPKKVYKFRLFGSRSTTTSRVTTYFVHGTNSSSMLLQTSGSHVGGTNVHGNSSSCSITDMIIPNAAGEIYIEVGKVSGTTYGYLGAMKMEEYSISDENLMALKTGDESENMYGDGQEGDSPEDPEIYSWFFEPETSQEQTLVKTDLILYPNPVTETVKLEGLAPDQSYKFTIYGANGNIVKTGIFVEGQTTEIDVSEQRSSLYILEIVNLSTNERETKRFVKTVK